MIRRGAVPSSQIGLVSASASINVKRSPAATDSDDNTALARRSFSIAMTCAACSRSKARVRPPGPGPISIVVPVSGPALRAIFFGSGSNQTGNSGQAICVPAYPCFQQAGARAAGRQCGCQIAICWIIHDETASDVIGHFAGHVYCRHKAVWTRCTGPGNIQTGAMIGRCADKIQPQR